MFKYDFYGQSIILQLGLPVLFKMGFEMFILGRVRGWTSYACIHNFMPSMLMPRAVCIYETAISLKLCLETPCSTSSSFRACKRI